MPGCTGASSNDRMSERKSRTVVFLTPGFSEPGGCASHGRKIANGLAERGWSVHVITRLGSGRSLRRIRIGGLSVTEIPGFGQRRLGGLLFLLIAVPLVVIRRRPYAYMALQLTSPATVAGVGSVLHRTKRLVVFSTSTGPAGEAAFVSGSRTSGIRRFLLGRASALVGQTPAAAAELERFVPGARVEVVPTPVRLPEHPPELTGTPNVLYTGRIVAGKNIERLFDVWPGVTQSVPNAKLIVVGSGMAGDPVESDLRHRAAADTVLSSAVTFTGWVADVHPYLELADVYAFPSSSEGMSNSLLEACALGRVVVASDIPANRAVLGDRYPLLIDPSDRRALLGAIQSALTDAALRSEARAQILCRVPMFSDVAVIDRIEGLLERSR
jgi:glycosyltransferase involved in cell wall biosynthesis